MSLPFNITNPGWNITSLLTSQEASFVTDLYAASAGASENEVLTWKSGSPSWEVSASGFADPLTTNGDIIARVSGVTTRLAKGSDGSFLGVSGGILGYYSPAGSGDVTGPASAVDSNFAAFNTTTGKLIKDSGSKASDFAAAGHNHTGVYAPALGTDDNYVTDAEKAALHASGSDNQTITNSSDSNSHTVTLSATGGSVQLIEGTNITLTTGGTASAGTVTIAASGGSGNVSKVGTPADNQVGVWTGDGTIEGDAGLTFDGDTLTATNNADTGAATALIVQGDRLNPANNDEVVIEMKLSDSAGNQDTMGTIRAQALDVTSTSEDSQLKFGTVVAGTLASRLALTGTALQPNTDNGIALGNATTNRWADLFLAEGGVINWDNGDATLTQSGDTLTLAGADLIVPDEVYGVGWDGSLEVPTKNAVYDKIQSLTGGGNVSKVGTPVDNQIGVWTGDGTIEGDTGLTWDGGMGITVSDTENKIGLAISQLDATNDKLALEVNGKIANGTAAKVTASTLVQFNDTDGANSDWSFNVAGNGWPSINLQSTGGTLASPTATASAAEISSIFSRFYNSANVQKTGSVIETYLSDNTSGSEDAFLYFATIKAGTLDYRLYLNNTALLPFTGDELALGSGGLPFSDLFLAEGGVINWDNGDATLTQTGNTLALAGANLTVGGLSVTRRSLSVQVFDGTTDVATGDGKAYITIPEALNGMNLVRAQATVVTAGTTNATTVMIHNKTDSQDMLSGAISIASGGTVGTVGTINTSYDDVATNDILRIDVDSVSTTAPKGLMIVLEFDLP